MIVHSKVLAEILALLVSQGDTRVFTHWLLYVELALVAVCGVIWVVKLTQCLGLFDPLLILPLMVGSFILFGGIAVRYPSPTQPSSLAASRCVTSLLRPTALRHSNRPSRCPPPRPPNRPRHCPPSLLTPRSLPCASPIRRAASSSKSSTGCTSYTRRPSPAPFSEAQPARSRGRSIPSACSPSSAACASSPWPRRSSKGTSPTRRTARRRTRGTAEAEAEAAAEARSTP